MSEFEIQLLELMKNNNTWWHLLISTLIGGLIAFLSGYIIMKAQERNNRVGMITGTLITRGGGAMLNDDGTETGEATYSLQLVSSYKSAKSMRWINLALIDKHNQQLKLLGNEVHVFPYIENRTPHLQTFTPITLQPSEVKEIVFETYFHVPGGGSRDKLWFTSEGSKAELTYLDEENKEINLLVPVRRQ